MGKFGRKIEIDLNPAHYNIAILGEGGIGKTTIAKEICEKLVGEDGYMHLNIGREDGNTALQGLQSEDIEDWAKFKEVVEDIIENKDTYPNLQMLICDTLDELIPLAEKESIRLWNKKNPDKKADTINAAWGSFGKGQDKAIDLILDMIWELKKVGVNTMIIAHIKRSDMVDPITQETYSKLTADTQQRYFNAIKNKMHFIGIGYINREIIKEKTGRKNVVTKKDIEINKAVSESRVISFRDDTYSVDSKSRFADIVDHIPFDSDAFIKAMQDAILAEHSKSGKSVEQAKKEQAKAQKEFDKKAAEYSENVKATKENEAKREEYLHIIVENFSEADNSTKVEAKKLLNDAGYQKFTEEDVPANVLKEIAELLS